MRFGGAASAAVLALALIGSRGARGQVCYPGTCPPPPAVQIFTQALGSSPEKEVELHVNGPSDVVQALLVFQPAGETGWHIHPGPVVVIVSSGALTETYSNGCQTVHPAGSVFFERAGEVHNVANKTGGLSVANATFLLPTGSQPLIPASDPGNVCRAD